MSQTNNERFVDDPKVGRKNEGMEGRIKLNIMKKWYSNAGPS